MIILQKKNTLDVYEDLILFNNLKDLKTFLLDLTLYMSKAHEDLYNFETRDDLPEFMYFISNIAFDEDYYNIILEDIQKLNIKNYTKDIIVSYSDIFLELSSLVKLDTKLKLNFFCSNITENLIHYTDLDFNNIIERLE